MGVFCQVICRTVNWRRVRANMNRPSTWGRRPAHPTSVMCIKWHISVQIINLEPTVTPCMVKAIGSETSCEGQDYQSRTSPASYRMVTRCTFKHISLHYILLHCITMHYISLYCITLQCTSRKSGHLSLSIILVEQCLLQ